MRIICRKAVSFVSLRIQARFLPALLRLLGAALGVSGLACGFATAMGLLDNGGPNWAAWPPFPLEHFSGKLIRFSVRNLAQS